MSDLVSIVIPAYNHGRYLDEAIRSVLAQDYPNVELIVLDDGSRDDTPEVLAKYGDAFHWESQANIGQSATLAKGWALARGSILGYLSADDVLLPQAVKRSVDALQRHPDVVLSYSDYELISPDSTVIRKVKAPETSRADMIARIVCAPGPGAFFRRTAYEAAGPWDLTLRKVADFDFFLRLRDEGEFLHIPEVLAQFRVHPGSQSYAVMDELGAEEVLHVVERYFGRPGVPREIAARKPQATARALLFSARVHLRAGRMKRGAETLAQAWRTDKRVFFTVSTGRLLANALLNRASHAVFWRVLRFVKPVRRP